MHFQVQVQNPGREFLGVEYLKTHELVRTVWQPTSMSKASLESVCRGRKTHTQNIEKCAMIVGTVFCMFKFNVYESNHFAMVFKNTKGLTTCQLVARTFGGGSKGTLVSC